MNAIRLSLTRDQSTTLKSFKIAMEQIMFKTHENQRTGVLLIAHGSRSSQANQDLFLLAERFKVNGYPITEPSFLELAEPNIMDGGKKCVEQGASKVVMLPYFLSAGVHVLRDLKEFKESLGAKYTHATFLLASPLGPHRLLEELLATRLKEALAPCHEETESDRSKIVSSSRTS